MLHLFISQNLRSCDGTIPAYQKDDFLPVVYVIYGHPPPYLLLNIELASRHNDVVVISSEKFPQSLRQVTNHINPFVNATGSLDNPIKNKADDFNHMYNVYYEDLGSYSESADKFSTVYEHLSRDTSPGRIKHE